MPSPKIALKECKLRDVGDWRFVFYKNLFAYVSSHAQTDSVQITPVGGIIDHDQKPGLIERLYDLKGQSLWHLVGDEKATARFVPGDETVYLLEATFS